MNVKLIILIGSVFVLNFVSGNYRGGHQRFYGGGHNRYQGGNNGHHSSHGRYHGCHHGHHGSNNHGHNGHQGHRHHDHRHLPFLNFEVLEPKGLTISMVQQSLNSTLFGIELSINKIPSETQCDVCQNITTVTFGKFIVEDDTVIIKKGDVLYYSVLVGENNNITRLHPQRLWVTESIISKCNCEILSEVPDIDVRFEQPIDRTYLNLDFSDGATNLPPGLDESYKENILFECEVDPLTNLCRTEKNDKLTYVNMDLENDVEILETIVEKMKHSCGPRGFTNMVRLVKLDSNMSDMDQLTDYVRSTFSVSPEMIQLFNRIRRVLSESGSPRVVLLDMSSYVDKQKVLYHAELNNINYIGDYDSSPINRRQ